MSPPRKTLGYHFVKSTYGSWLPGDARGHWSEAWDEQIGFHAPHTLNPSDPARLRLAQERMKHPEVRLSPRMVASVAAAIERCASASPWSVAALAIEVTHVHLLITYSGLDIERTTRWLAQEMTRAIHRETDHRGPVWGAGAHCNYLFERSHWERTVAYIERHNLRRGLPARPYPFITVESPRCHRGSSLSNSDRKERPATPSRALQQRDV